MLIKLPYFENKLFFPLRTITNKYVDKKKTGRHSFSVLYPLNCSLKAVNEDKVHCFTSTVAVGPTTLHGHTRLHKITLSFLAKRI